MTIKRELIALAVRLLADNSSVIRKPEPFEAFLSELFTGETYDERMAREIDEDAARFARTIKNVRRGREFKKIASRF